MAFGECTLQILVELGYKNDNQGTELIFNNGYVNEYLLDLHMNFSIWLQWKANGGFPFHAASNCIGLRCQVSGVIMHQFDGDEVNSSFKS